MSKTTARFKRMRPLASLLAAGLAMPVIGAPSEPFPTYVPGEQAPGTWVVGNGQVVTPAGIQVDLGIEVRAKAVAINPNTATHTAAVLTMGAPTAAVQVFDTRTGQVLQTYAPTIAGSSPAKTDKSGSYGGITYSPDGTALVFSQDGNSNVTIAHVSSAGLLSDNAQVSVPPDNSFITCFPNSPIGNNDALCGTFYSGYTAFPGGVAVARDGKSAYALLNQNNTLTKIDLTAKAPAQGVQIRVGNAPHSILIDAAGTTAYISNEGGRAATQADFQIYSAGTPIVADPYVGSATTGTVSVVDLPSMTVKATIDTGLHPTGIAFYRDSLLVANAYDDTISVIDTATNTVRRTISVGLPISLPGKRQSIFGASPDSIAVDAEEGVAYVALYHANAIAVVDLNADDDGHDWHESDGRRKAVRGLIPVAYAPSSVIFDKTDRTLIVSNDKGIGTRNSQVAHYGVTGYNSHEDNGTVSIVPVPREGALAALTEQVYQNNHWDLAQNIASASGGHAGTPPQALPARIGDPSLIKHVFLIIRENRTYDQILGDVAAANGDASLAVFGPYTPNAHTLVQRFPLFDNFYDPSRQSADGHQWITEAIAPYADDIQSPDWVRSYPGGNAGDALAYTKNGFLWSNAAKKGLAVKIYGEYVENDIINTPTKPTWRQFYEDALAFEAGSESTLVYQNAITAESSVPAVSNYLVKNFPEFDTNIPDQFRVDLWLQDFKKDLAANNVPNLTVLWIMCDHTGGAPTPQAQQADNDLAVGRIIDTISHSEIWDKSAIFMEEDDAQNGVDHVDGHRSPGYIVSPYVVQGGPTDHTYYTQMNMTRTIEQILGIQPTNQFDLTASPMRTAFVTGTPPQSNFAPYTYVKPTIALDDGVATASNTTSEKLALASLKDPRLAKLKAAWIQKKNRVFAGQDNKPDAQDPNFVNHYNWYMATNFSRPYPGEKKILSPSQFKGDLHRVADKDD